MATWWTILIETFGAAILAAGLIGSFLYLHQIRQKARQDKEIAIHESNRRYGQLFNTVSDVVYVHDLQGDILDINETAARLVGGGVNDFVGKGLLSVIGARHKNDVIGYLNEFARGEKEVSGALPVVCRHRGEVLILEFRSRITVQRGRSGYIQGIARDITEQKRYERSLRKRDRQMMRLLQRAEETQEDLRIVSREMLRVQEEERRKISRELHDEIGQLLAAMTLNLQLMKKDSNLQDEARLRMQIHDAERLASEMFGRIRKVLRELRPVEFEESGMLPSILLLIREYAARTGIQTSLLEECPEIERLSDEKKTALFRIIQESLTNASRHAEAHTVTIQLHCAGDQIVLTICDDGKGFEVSDLSRQGRSDGGMGFLGMRERVGLVHGEFRIESEVGKGTSIYATVPIGETNPPSSVFRREES